MRRAHAEMHSPNGIAFFAWNDVMVATLNVYNCRSMRIYFKNNHVKFHSDRILNDRALGFLKRAASSEKKEEEEEEEEQQQQQQQPQQDE